MPTENQSASDEILLVRQISRDTDRSGLHRKNRGIEGMTTAPVPSIPAEALQVLQHVAGLYSGGAIKGDPTQLFITGHQVWLARQGLERLAGASRTKADEPDACLRARVADLLHLLQFAKIETSSPGDAAQAEVAMNDLERMLAAAPAAPVAVQVPAAFYWQDLEVPARKAQRHGPYFGWPTAEALARVGSDTVPVALYTAQPAAEQPDTVKVLAFVEDYGRNEFERMCREQHRSITRDDRKDPPLAWGYANSLTHDRWCGWAAACKRLRALLARGEA